MDARAASELAARLELDLTTSGVCLSCLTYVAFPLDFGREHDARREAETLAPELWADGLEPVTVRGLEGAVSAGIPGASEAIDEVQALGCRSRLVQAIVWRLAEQMVEDMRRRAAARQSEPSGARARTGWPVTSAMSSKSRS